MPWFVWVGSLQSLGTRSPKSWGCWDGSRERCWQEHLSFSEKPFVSHENQSSRGARGNKNPRKCVRLGWVCRGQTTRRSRASVSLSGKWGYGGGEG